MATTNNPNICNINNNLIKPTLFISPSSLSSPSSSSSTITNNYNYNIIINHNDNNNINDVFQAHHKYTMNMSTTTSSSSWLDHHNHPTTHNSLSQLLLGGVYMEEEAKKIGNWDEHQVLLQQQQQQYFEDQVKQESSVNSYIINTKNNNYGAHQININIPTSPPHSCVTNAFNNNININNNNNGNMLDFSSKCIKDNLHVHQSNTNSIHVPNHSFEGKTNATRGGVAKRAKVQQSSTQRTFKARKEKLGDRITILHQLVSPFGKTDTASVLLESIGYIRFLHSQLEALSLPYFTSGARTTTRPHNNADGERKCKIREDPGQELLEEAKDLKSRGLCLVPLSCTMNIGNDDGADYWAPSFGGGSQ